MSNLEIAVIIWACLVAFFCACSCAVVAGQRGRDVVLWFFLGLFLGPVAQIAIGPLEKRDKPAPTAPASYPVMKCTSCGKTARIGGNCPHCGAPT